MSLLSYALTTVARQKDYMGITSTAYDTVLERLVNSCTDMLENYCGRRFKQTSYTQEVYSADGSHNLYIRNYPIASGSTFTLERRAATDNTDSWETIPSNEYQVEYDWGYVVSVTGYYFAKWPRNHRVTYTAGYNYDNTATFLSEVSGGAAADLELACWMLVAKVFNNRQLNSDVKSESIGDYSVTFEHTLAIDDFIQSLLAKYRRITGF